MHQLLRYFKQFQTTTSNHSSTLEASLISSGSTRLAEIDLRKKRGPLTFLVAGAAVDADNDGHSYQSQDHTSTGYGDSLESYGSRSQHTELPITTIAATAIGSTDLWQTALCMYIRIINTSGLRYVHVYVHVRICTYMHMCHVYTLGWVHIPVRLSMFVHNRLFCGILHHGFSLMLLLLQLFGQFFLPKMTSPSAKIPVLEPPYAYAYAISCHNEQIDAP